MMAAAVMVIAGCSSGSPPGAFRTEPYSAAPSNSSASPTPSGSAASGLAWRDDFNGKAGTSPDPANWTYDLGGGGWGNQELQTYTSEPTNVSMTGDGYLRISAVKDPVTGAYTSARLVSRGLNEVTDGILQARIKIPAGKGLLSAFWLLGSNITSVGYPQSGEIDIVEINQDPTIAYTTLHGPKVSDPTQQWQISSTFPLATPSDGDFHTYSLQKSPGQLAFAIDGAVTGVVQEADLPADDQWIFDSPFYVILNVAVGGVLPGNPDDSTVFPADMLVDWVSYTALPAG
jgi:beta-glucanase (GH16 family)